MRTIAVAAHKGGAGKTTVAVNLGAALAESGARVLLVDADPQGSLAAALGLTPGRPSLYDVIAGDAPARAAIMPAGVERLELLPAGLDLAGAETELSAAPGWHRALGRALRALDSYDWAVIDTPPGLGALAFMALQAADAVVALCPPEQLAYRALAQLLVTIERARALTPGLRLAGIVPAMVTRGSRGQREVLARLEAEYGGLLLPEIPRRVALQEAAAAGRSVLAHAPRSEAAAAFRVLALALRARLEQEG